MAEPTLEVFELWRTASSSVDRADLSFAVDESPEAPVWSLDLGSSVEAGERRLADLEAEVRRADEQLDRIPERLDRWLPEREIRQWAESGDVSFARSDPGESESRIGEALERLSRMVTHLAWVETRVQARVVGRTVVGWIGTTKTVRVVGVDSRHGVLHQRNVALAVSSRLTLLRTLVAVQRAAIKIWMVLGSSGAIAAVDIVSLAWRYVHRGLVEVRNRV